MTLHATGTYTENEAKKIAQRKSRKYLIAIVLAASTLTAAGGAWAAMKVSGDGQASAAAYTEQQLQITNATFSGPLFPGGKVNLTMTVKNPNPFKVKMTTIALKGNSAAITCAPGEAQHLSGPLGSSTTYQLPAADQIVVDADNSSATLTVRNAVQLSNAATKGCALTVPFTVSGESLPN